MRDKQRTNDQNSNARSCDHVTPENANFLRRWPYTGAGCAPAANVARQPAREGGVLRRQRERANIAGEREGRREVQEGHVV